MRPNIHTNNIHLKKLHACYEAAAANENNAKGPVCTLHSAQCRRTNVLHTQILADTRAGHAGKSRPTHTKHARINTHQCTKYVYVNIYIIHVCIDAYIYLQCTNSFSHGHMRQCSRQVHLKYEYVVYYIRTSFAHFDADGYFLACMHAHITNIIIISSSMYSPHTHSTQFIIIEALFLVQTNTHNAQNAQKSSSTRT